jgi:hypothetical protein
VRAGRVTTRLGLNNDTQDMDFLHTFAILPQSIYPIDWRSQTISHTGAGLYGDLQFARLGTLSYTAYAGRRPEDPTTGYFHTWKGINVFLDKYQGRMTGGDARWETKFGLLLGVSFLSQYITGSGGYGVPPAATGPYSPESKADQTAQYYAQYTLKNFRFDGEYRRNVRDYWLHRSAVTTTSAVDQRSYYVATTYRVNKLLEVGGYRSIFWTDLRKDVTPQASHEYDTVIAARFNLNSHWNLKAEGHFMDGTPTTPSAARGFYLVSNPVSLKPATNIPVLRTGYNF